MLIIYKTVTGIAICCPPTDLDMPLAEFAGRVVPGGTQYRLVAAPTEAQAGFEYSWDAEDWTPPDPAVLLAEARAIAIAAMTARIDQFTAQFTAGVPAAELASWPTKAAAAELVLAGGTSPIVTAEADALGQDPKAVATKIAAKSAAYTAIIGAVSGLRQSTEAAIKAAATPKAVDAALVGAQAAAGAMAIKLGLVF
jgi:hypothetical protein